MTFTKEVVVIRSVVRVKGNNARHLGLFHCLSMTNLSFDYSVLSD